MYDNPPGQMRPQTGQPMPGQASAQPQAPMNDGLEQVLGQMLQDPQQRAILGQILQQMMKMQSSQPAPQANANALTMP